MSIGFDIGYDVEEDARYLHKHNIQVYKSIWGITEQFNDIFKSIAELVEPDPELYEDVFLYFLALGEMLGFKWDQIEEAYMSKNAINHERQSTGY